MPAAGVSLHWLRDDAWLASRKPIHAAAVLIHMEVHRVPLPTPFLLAGVLLASALPAHAELPHAPAYIDDSAYPAAARQRILPPMFEQKLGSLRYLAKPGDP